MKLDDFRASDNVEDHRDGSTGGGSTGGLPIGRGGMGLGAIVVVLIVSYFTGISPQTLFGVVNTVTGNGGGIVTSNNPAPRQTGPLTDADGQFVAKVLGATEDTWTQVFQEQLGKTYSKPRLVIYNGEDDTGRCGSAQSAMGPFYCPNDQKIYLDTAFFEEMKSRFNACPTTQGACAFAQAYVIAHEVGHHVQNLIGILPKVDQMKQTVSATQANALSVRLELQADCYAGVWGHSTEQRSIIDQSDVQAGLNAAAAVGDDRLQKMATGSVMPEKFTHGTSAQRAKWLQTGLDSGRIDACDTFSIPQP